MGKRPVSTLGAEQQARRERGLQARRERGRFQQEMQGERNSHWQPPKKQQSPAKPWGWAEPGGLEQSKAQQLSCPQAWDTALPGHTAPPGQSALALVLAKEHSWVKCAAGAELALLLCSNSQGWALSQPNFFVPINPRGQAQQGKGSKASSQFRGDVVSAITPSCASRRSCLSLLPSPDCRHTCHPITHFPFDELSISLLTFFHSFIFPSAHNNHTSSGSIGLDVPPKELSCPLLREVKIR